MPFIQGQWQARGEEVEDTHGRGEDDVAHADASRCIEDVYRPRFVRPEPGSVARRLRGQMRDSVDGTVLAQPLSQARRIENVSRDLPESGRVRQPVGAAMDQGEHLGVTIDEAAAQVVIDKAVRPRHQVSASRLAHPNSPPYTRWHGDATAQPNS